MEKLEQYIEQVCHGIGGPYELRQHVRQELREHLADAVAQHQAAGLSEADAIAKALNEFGQPDEVRSELESAYGRRTVWIIDKALQWKEKTMRAKWLWTTWAHLALATVIALEVFFITFNVVFIVPKFQYLVRHGLIDADMLDEQAASAWMPGFLNGLTNIAGRHATWWLLLAIVLIGLFEWRVKSENKPFMRLSVLGSVAVGLMVVVTLTAAALIIPPCLAMPAFRGFAQPYAVQQVAKIDEKVFLLEFGLGQKSADGMKVGADAVSPLLANLAKNTMAVRALALPKKQLTVIEETRLIEEMQGNLKAAIESLAEFQQQYCRREDVERLATTVQKFRISYEPVREAAKRLVP